jgi:hypothetical protein
MKIEKVFFADTALIQYTYKFNQKNKTEISLKIEHKEGVPFSVIDFKDVNKELIFDFAYNLAIIQKELSDKQITYLDTRTYPMPDISDENYTCIL